MREPKTRDCCALLCVVETLGDWCIWNIWILHGKSRKFSNMSIILDCFLMFLHCKRAWEIKWILFAFQTLWYLALDFGAKNKLQYNEWLPDLIDLIKKTSINKRYKVLSTCTFPSVLIVKYFTSIIVQRECLWRTEGNCFWSLSFQYWHYLAEAINPDPVVADIVLDILTDNTS